MELQFPNNTFDLSHTSGVLCQIKNSVAALK